MMKKLAILMTALFTLSAHAAPVFNIFELGIAHGKTARYDAVGKHNIRTSIATEQGTLAMYSVKQKANPNMVYMVELYADDAAYQVHRKSPQYAEFVKQSPQILTEHKVKFDTVLQFAGDKKITQTADTKTNFVSVSVKPEHAAAFKAIVLDEMAQSLQKENGVLAMYAATDAKQPEKWYFFEIYASEAAYQSRRATPHFQKYLNETQNMIADTKVYVISPSELGNQGGQLWTAER
ncbi:autoinducer-2 (AI-2) modifying protein LsrG [Kingella potus]|uniref:Autoinducer-2 (AI-2) modifying protein LsrG n=1 Tax=Kingella potus TaxID=265175 RepID=A0A377R4P2_9NEIS|nr:antibiotic biosynthesis monooxygenase [Kingella potus]UOP00417.1 antibiotic biosynthesis monooxygenase [Kingella potus]STR02515.1 autoinducer-2 (AI-2) modifying protein LsrG [Kingella potus]